MANKLTPKCVAFLCNSEAIVPEAYKDSEGIWTWGIGLAVTGGHDVLQYKDKPTSIVTCLKAGIDTINASYLLPVLKAFGNRNLSEAQLGAALSFHWNTGAICRAQWVKDFMGGNMVQAEKNLRTNYTGGGALQGRRDKEADLFFRGFWPDPMKTLIYDVSKPSYKPGHARSFDPLPTLVQIMV